MNPQPGQTPRALIGALSAAIVALFALILVVAWPRLFPSKQLTSVTFTTVPKGATIEIEGRPAGTASDGTYVARDLEVGRAYPVVARLDGYEPKSAVVQPQAGVNQLTLELAAKAAIVIIETNPPGATVKVDGKDLGQTPLTLTTLPPGQKVQVVLEKTGYNALTNPIEVPGPGKELRIVQALPVSDDLARIRLESDPPGAQVVQNGQLLAGVQTPAEVLVEAGKPQRFVLTLPKHVPAVIEPFTPARGASGVTKTGKLVPGTTVRVEANQEGTVTIAPAPHCQNLTTPAECVLAPSMYTLDFTTPGGKATRPLKVGPASQASFQLVRLEFGFVEAGAGKMFLYGGQRVKRLVLEAGPRSVTITDENGARQITVRVKVGTTVTAE